VASKKRKGREIERERERQECRIIFPVERRSIVYATDEKES